jgi:signal transduction histidine kinase
VARPDSRTAKGNRPANDARGRTAAAAGSVIVALGAAGWAVPFLGFATPLSLALAVMILAPIAFGWGAQVQGAVAGAGIIAYVWGIPVGTSLPERLPNIILALTVGLVASIVSALLLDRHREAERVQRQKLARKTQEALSGLEIRAGVGSLTHGGTGIDVDDPVASIERIAVELGKGRVELRKQILHEREMNAHFIGQAAHEFRTPLAVIQTAAEALKLYSGRMSSHQQHVRLSKIEESVTQMTELLHNALTFSRADAGKVKVERKPIDLRAIAQEVARDVQANIGPRDFQVSVRGAARLPQLDESLAREIMINLLTNAAKYSPEGGHIEVEVVTGATEVRIRVTDSGIGIAPADQEHIFEAFRRGANVGDIPGTGLGLAITKRAVESHGGTITLESKLGAGTTFTVTMPERTESAEPLLARQAS